MNDKRYLAKEVGPRLFYHLREIANRWGRSQEELLCLAAAGELPVYLPYFGGATVVMSQVMGYDPNQFPESLNPEWGVSLSAEDLATVGQTGKVLVTHAFKCVEDGLEHLTYSQPIVVTVDMLVVPRENVGVFEDSRAKELSETERDSLLKMLAACALAVAGDASVCYKDGVPNYSQIAKRIVLELGRCPAPVKSKLQLAGLGEESLRKKITAGMRLLLTSPK